MNGEGRREREDLFRQAGTKKKRSSCRARSHLGSAVLVEVETVLLHLANLGEEFLRETKKKRETVGEDAASASGVGQGLRLRWCAVGIRAKMSSAARLAWGAASAVRPLPSAIHHPRARSFFVDLASVGRRRRRATGRGSDCDRRRRTAGRVRRGERPGFGGGRASGTTARSASRAGLGNSRARRGSSFFIVSQGGFVERSERRHEP